MKLYLHYCTLTAHTKMGLMYENRNFWGKPSPILWLKYITYHIWNKILEFGFNIGEKPHLQYKMYIITCITKCIISTKTEKKKFFDVSNMGPMLN